MFILEFRNVPRFQSPHKWAWAPFVSNQQNLERVHILFQDSRSSTPPHPLVGPSLQICKPWNFEFNKMNYYFKTKLIGKTWINLFENKSLFFERTLIRNLGTKLFVSILLYNLIYSLCPVWLRLFLLFYEPVKIIKRCVIK